MANLMNLRRLGALCRLGLRFAGLVLAGPLLAAACVAGAVAQDNTAQDNGPENRTVLRPTAPATTANRRLILKDGSYQIVREYQVVGDRVRYFSQERADWEELPADLVDWDATRKWERDQANAAADNSSPATKAAEEIDKEEADARADESGRMPEVAKGLELPDQDGVFVLDTFEGTPELVELPPVDLSLNQRNRHGLGTLNPLAGQKADLEIDGAHAKVHLHVNDPAIYLSLDTASDNQPLTTHAFKVNTDTGGGKGAENGKHGAHSASSGFAIVRVDQRKAVRLVGAINVSRAGTVTQSEDVIAARGEVLPGKHWLKLTPNAPLTIGEYALVEIISPEDISQTVWDFRVDPRDGDNPGSLGPILK
ncbi:MAG TPA: hypothetical protein VE291_02505 [Terracidiphilus sp.]|jgi:hypothetical protein|nr:hypothetical protein [Terracidiphilus sp.]